MKRWFVACTVLLLLAGCAMRDGSPLPGRGAVPALVSPGVRHHRAKVRLVIKVPRARHRRRRGRYVSPATATLLYSINGGSAKSVAISTSNPECSIVGPVSYLACTIVIGAPVGSDTFSFTTEDSNGNVLSANTHVIFNVEAGVTNTIPALILGGVAASLEYFTAPNPYAGGLSYYGVPVIGNQTQTLDVVPIDADGNVIVGPGAPQPVASSPPTDLNLQTPSPSSPNQWTMTTTYSATDPTVPETVTLSVSATPVPNSGATTVSTSIPLELYQPWIYAVSFTNGTVQAFDEQGNAKTPTASSPFAVLSGLQASAITYDSGNHQLYVSSIQATGSSPYSSPFAFDAEGNEIAAAENCGSLCPNNSVEGFGITYDPLNAMIYMTGHQNTTYYILDYNESFSNTSNFNSIGSDDQVGIAFDPHNSTFYVSDRTSHDMIEYNTSYSSVGTFGSSVISGSNVNGVLFDPHNNLIYVANGSDVLAFSESGTQQTGLGSCFTAPSGGNFQGLTYDPFNGTIYIADYGKSAIVTCDESGNAVSVSGTFSGTNGPAGVAVVP